MVEKLAHLYTAKTTIDCPMSPVCFTMFHISIAILRDFGYFPFFGVEPRVKPQQRPFRLRGHVEESRRLAVPKGVHGKQT